MSSRLWFLCLVLETKIYKGGGEREDRLGISRGHLEATSRNGGLFGALVLTSWVKEEISPYHRSLFSLLLILLRYVAHRQEGLPQLTL